jgi:tRNA modification GTPase
MNISPADTIAAVATPPGEGAIAVIRISGSEALAVADRVFRGRIPLARARGYTLHHGTIAGSEGEEVDEVLAAVFRAPRSYTGEDCVEISCHGGLFVTAAVLNGVFSAGARQAEPGEFTRRAYLNGKMDLSRAEAVASLISSKSDRAYRASLEQLRGRLAGRVELLRTELKRLCALLEIDLDFSEEGISLIGKAAIESGISEVKGELETLAGTFTGGKIYREGVSVVIAGHPNAGKSSLFNALLKESRAIVTPVPGTTRDYLEENVLIDGILFRLKDTAGLRQSDDAVESEGIARTVSSMETADVILLVEDASAPSSGRKDLLNSVPDSRGQELILVRNKIDLLTGENERVDGVEWNGRKRSEVWVSAVSGKGVHMLADQMVRAVSQAGLSTHETVCVISRRHAESLLKGAKNLGLALDSLAKGMTNEFIAFDVRESLSALGEITGEISSEEILNSIFSEFCIGK